MPDIKSLEFKRIIQNINVGRHTIYVKSEPWGKLLNAAGLYHPILRTGANHPVSRNYLLKMPNKNPSDKCLEILMWGYSSGGRGNNIKKALTNLNQIAKAAAKENLPWLEYYNTLNQIEGIGISTITKFAYFYGHTFNGYKPVILDEQIAETLSAKVWTNAPSPVGNRNAWQYKYVIYLEEINNLANALKVNADQIELFLYLLGPHFK